MSKLYSSLQIALMVIAIGIMSGFSSYAQHNDVYNLTLEELMSVNVIPDSASNFAPDYEISIEDLMNLELVRELKIEHYLDLSYDIPLKDLMEITIDLTKNNGIVPTYEMSLNGLTQLELKENVYVIEKIGLTYDLSLDGIMKLSLENPPK